MNGCFVLVRHKVSDFTTWKKVYDSHAPKRAEAGLTEKYLLRVAAEPNNVVMLFEAQDIGRAQAFAQSPGLRDEMQKAGVVEKPDMYFLTR